MNAPMRALCTALTLLLWGCALSRAPGTGGRSCPSTRGQQIVSLLNLTRAREKLPELRVDVRLIRAAQAHAEDMAAGGFSGHNGSDGSLPADRADRVSYPWLFVAENASAGYSTAPSTFAAWMDSPTHRANNLHLEAEHVGVGYAENGETQYRAYWVVVFAASSEPAMSTTDGCHP